MTTLQKALGSGPLPGNLRRLGSTRNWLLQREHQQHTEHCRDDRHPQHRLDVAVEPLQRSQRQQWPDHRAHRVGSSVEAKCFAAMLDRDPIDHQGIPRRTSDALAQSINATTQEYDGPSTRRRDQHLANCSQPITDPHQGHFRELVG
ncbi:MAG: hypothetical protein V9E81_06165 [Marmoricola sp.]